MQRLKTGALIRFAVRGRVRSWAAPRRPKRRRWRAMPTISASPSRSGTICSTGVGDSAVTGKDGGRDRAVGKATFVELLGEDGARAKLPELRMRAVAPP